jgi:hypothetical protein
MLGQGNEDHHPFSLPSRAFRVIAVVFAIVVVLEMAYESHAKKTFSIESVNQPYMLIYGAEARTRRHAA